MTDRVKRKRRNPILEWREYKYAYEQHYRNVVERTTDYFNQWNNKEILWRNIDETKIFTDWELKYLAELNNQEESLTTKDRLYLRSIK